MKLRVLLIVTGLVVLVAPIWLVLEQLPRGRKRARPMGTRLLVLSEVR